MDRRRTSVFLTVCLFLVVAVHVHALELRGFPSTFAGVQTFGSPIRLPDGAVGAPAITSVGDITSGLYFSGNNVRVSRSSNFVFGTTGNFEGSPYLQTTALNLGNNGDAFLARAAAAKLAVRNGTTTQGFQIYNTYTDASNNEYLEISGMTGQGFTFTALTNGTGADNLGFLLVPAGTGGVTIDGEAARTLRLNREQTAATAGRNLTVQGGGAVSAGTDLAGGHLILQGGESTGTGAPGQVKMQGPVISHTSGTSDGTQAERWICNYSKVLTDGGAVDLISAPSATSTVIGGVIEYVIEVRDTAGTPAMQIEQGRTVWKGHNVGGTVTANVTETSTQTLSSGTLTTTWAVTGANPAVISLNADTSLTAASGFPRITACVMNLAPSQTITMQ